MDIDKNRDITETVIIDGEEYSKETVEVLMGEKGTDGLREGWKPIAKALSHPKELPFLLEDIVDIENDKELRLGLVRIQVNAQLSMKENLDFYKQQLFTAKSIEIILYNTLLLKATVKRKEKKG